MSEFSVEWDSRSFRLGSNNFKISDFVNKALINHIVLKLDLVSDPTTFTRFKEVIRFLYLSNISSENLFFPADLLTDKIWHELIIETAEYAKICKKIGSGKFVHHKGISHRNYLDSMASEKSHDEQLSWLSNYIHNFGPIEKESFEILPIALSLAKRLGASLGELNELGSSILRISRASELHPKTISSYLEESIFPASRELDQSVALMQKSISEILPILVAESDEEKPFIISNEVLEEIFGTSAALGFTLGQHFAAVERLVQSEIWKSSNKEKWTLISKAKRLCGLATTHLVKPGIPLLTGEKNEKGYLVSGLAPWSCGYDLFQDLVVGFVSGDEIVFALSEFPSSMSECKSMKATIQDLAILNSTSSISISFTEHFISESSIISTRKLNSEVKMRQSRYIGYELGIGKKAMDKTEAYLIHSSHPKISQAKKRFDSLRCELSEIENLRISDPMNPLLGHLIGRFNRSAIRLLSLCEGAKSLTSGSCVSRWQQEIILFDAVIQSPETLRLKLEQS